MDLVYVSDRHYRGGDPVVDLSDRRAGKGILHKAARRLKDTDILQGHAQVIPAKVPIIKFQDKMTKLHVDISFENLSGVQAQATFAEWKAQHPDMIYMVALMKQFLVMHGLNEVHTGGIGGYSIICLIVSYLQLREEKPENLGDCFLGFLKYYGEFDLATKRIQMHPPGVVDKVSYYQRSTASIYAVHFFANTSRPLMASMAVWRSTMVFLSRTPIAPKTTYLVDPTEPRLHSMHSKKHTTPSKIALMPPAQVKTSDPVFWDVCWAATTSHIPSSETI